MARLPKAFLMRLLEAFKRQRSSWILAEMIAATLAIGVLDSITGYEVRLLPFYSGPIFVVAWFCRRNTALVFGLAAGFVSLGADWISRDPDLMEWSRQWEVIRHITTCFVVAWVITVLKARTQGAQARIQLLEH